MNTFTHVEPTDTIEAIIHDIIEAQIADDEDDIQALIQVLMEKLDTLYSEPSEKHEGYIHVIRKAQDEAKALKTRASALTNLAKQLSGTLLDDMIQHGEKQTNAGKFRLRCQICPEYKRRQHKKRKGTDRYPPGSSTLFLIACSPNLRAGSPML